MPTALRGVEPLVLRSAAEVRRALAGVGAEMAALGYPEDDAFAVRLGLQEALDNALRHGNRRDPAKAARLWYRVTRSEVLAEVEDDGPGFDPHRVPDPRLPANRERPGGRGLLLMRHFLNAVVYNDRGNSVFLRKTRSER